MLCEMVASLGSNPRPVLALVGPTGSGKSAIAIELARVFSFLELVSVDSMTIYRKMSIGTAKPTRDELKDVSYHLLDVIDPWQEYSVSQYQIDARRVLGEIEQRGNYPLFVGGTGLYYQAIVDGLEIPGNWPELREELECRAATEEGLKSLYEMLLEIDPRGAARMEPSNRRRIVRAVEVSLGSGKPFSLHGPGLFSRSGTEVLAVGIDLGRTELFDRIEKRLDTLLREGWIDEVRNLLADSAGLSKTACQALGYKEIIQFIQGDLELSDARSQILARTKRLAKRQMAWFRRDPRIRWFHTPEMAREELVSIVSDIGGKVS